MPSVQSAHKEHINRYKMAHMIGVAEYMRERAPDYGVDPDSAYVVGLLHDIGYLHGRKDHEEVGADIVESMGMNEDIVDAIRIHGGWYNYDITKATPLSVLLIEADMSVNAKGYRVGFNKRLAEITTRYGDPTVAEDNIRYVKAYQAAHGIRKPSPDVFRNMDRDR